jgi:hypothetical protein
MASTNIYVYPHFCRRTDHELRQSTPCIVASQHFVQEEVLESWKENPNVFNNTSLHVFPIKNSEKLPDCPQQLPSSDPELVQYQSSIKDSSKENIQLVSALSTMSLQNHCKIY